MSAHVLEAPTEPLDDSRPSDVAPGNVVPDLQVLVNKPADEPAPAEVEIDSSVIEMAKGIGFDDTDLDGLDQASIERMVAAVDRRAIDAVSRVMRQNPASAGVTGAAPAGPQPPAGAPVQPPWMQQQQPQAFKVELDDSYDDKLVQTLNQMNQFYQHQLAQLNQALQSQQQVATVDEDPLTRWFDGQFSGLSGEYHSVFGKGTLEDTRPGSSEEQNRFELHRAFTALKQAYPSAQDDVLFQRALRASFSHVQDVSDKKKLAAQAKARSQSTIGRPSGRKAALNTERDPITGVSVTTIDEIQREIDRRLDR